MQYLSIFGYVQVYVAPHQFNNESNPQITQNSTHSNKSDDESTACEDTVGDRVVEIGIFDGVVVAVEAPPVWSVYRLENNPWQEN